MIPFDEHINVINKFKDEFNKIDKLLNKRTSLNSKETVDEIIKYKSMIDAWNDLDNVIEYKILPLISNRN